MNAAESIKLYNTLFYVCLAVAILALLLAVILFFALDIRTVFALMTGTAKQEEPQKRFNRGRTNTKNTAQRNRRQAKKSRKAQPSDPVESNTADLDDTVNQSLSKRTETLQTAVLEIQPDQTMHPESDVSTSDLDTEKTVPLSFTELGNRKPSGRFEIIGSEMLIFTDEIIPCWGFSKNI